MANKKPKSGKSKGGGSKPSSKKPAPQQVDPARDLALQVTPQDRVAAVKPLWETLSQEERVQLLTVDLETLRVRAKQQAEAARLQSVQVEGELDGGLLSEADPLLLLGLDPGLPEVLEEGTKRLSEQSTWKLWQWPQDNAEFMDAEAFRQHVTEHFIREDLRKLLPRDEPKALERPAEAAFRQRMVDLMQKVQANNRQPLLEEGLQPGRGKRRHANNSAGGVVGSQDVGGGHAGRDQNVELLNILLDVLVQEHDGLLHSLLVPLTSFVMEMLPEESRESTKYELFFEDLDKLVPDDVARMVEWLNEKVDALSTRLKAEPKEDEEEEEENLGDVDLWSLTSDGKELQVNAKWLQHLQDRLLGEDGHPHKVKPGEDVHHCGLVLEWVYGSIVSTAEKARDGAKRALGSQPPSALDAHATLVKALEDYYTWETRLKQAKEILNEILRCRLEAVELAKSSSSNGTAAACSTAGVDGVGASDQAVAPAEENVPDEVVVAMLRREVLLTRAKLHYMVFEHLLQEKLHRTLKAQLRMGEPEFERLKRELEEVKHAPRSGLDGTYRSAAEMERHRHQLADAAIEEQLEVQTAFREHGARLQGIYDRKQKCELDMSKRETEVKQLQGWKGTVESLIEKFSELLVQQGCVQPSGSITAANGNGAAAGDIEEGGGGKGDEGSDDSESSAVVGLTPQQHLQLAKLRNHFHKDVRKQLYTDADDKAFFDNIKTEVREVTKRLEEARVALQHLETHLLNVACDDPGAAIGTQLALPILQERLDARAVEFAARKAEMAEHEIIKMESEAAEREAAERERRRQAKLKKTEKARGEKERLAAEKLARELEEHERKLQDARKREVAAEEERLRRLKEMEELRRAEEAFMEQRRQELLNDENGYWRQRMMMEDRHAADVAAAHHEQERSEGSTEANGGLSSSSSLGTDDDGAPAKARAAAGPVASGRAGAGGQPRPRCQERDQRMGNGCVKGGGHAYDRRDEGTAKPPSRPDHRDRVSSDRLRDQQDGGPCSAPQQQLAAVHSATPATALPCPAVAAPTAAGQEAGVVASPPTMAAVRATEAPAAGTPLDALASEQHDVATALAPVLSLAATAPSNSNLLPPTTAPPAPLPAAAPAPPPLVASAPPPPVQPGELMYFGSMPTSVVAQLQPTGVPAQQQQPVPVATEQQPLQQPQALPQLQAPCPAVPALPQPQQHLGPQQGLPLPPQGPQPGQMLPHTAVASAPQGQHPLPPYGYHHGPHMVGMNGSVQLIPGAPAPRHMGQGGHPAFLMPLQPMMQGPGPMGQPMRHGQPMHSGNSGVPKLPQGTPTGPMLMHPQHMRPQGPGSLQGTPAMTGMPMMPHMAPRPSSLPGMLPLPPGAQQMMQRPPAPAGGPPANGGPVPSGPPSGPGPALPPVPQLATQPTTVPLLQQQQQQQPSSPPLQPPLNVPLPPPIPQQQGHPHPMMLMAPMVGPYQQQQHYTNGMPPHAQHGMPMTQHAGSSHSAGMNGPTSIPPQHLLFMYPHGPPHSMPTGQLIPPLPGGVVTLQRSAHSEDSGGSVPLQGAMVKVGALASNGSSTLSAGAKPFVPSFTTRPRSSFGSSSLNPAAPAAAAPAAVAAAALAAGQFAARPLPMRQPGQGVAPMLPLIPAPQACGVDGMPLTPFMGASSSGAVYGARGPLLHPPAPSSISSPDVAQPPSSAGIRPLGAAGALDGATQVLVARPAAASASLEQHGGLQLAEPSEMPKVTSSGAADEIGEPADAVTSTAPLGAVPQPEASSAAPAPAAAPSWSAIAAPSVGTASPHVHMAQPARRKEAVSPPPQTAQHPSQGAGASPAAAAAVAASAESWRQKLQTSVINAEARAIPTRQGTPLTGAAALASTSSAPRGTVRIDCSGAVFFQTAANGGQRQALRLVRGLLNEGGSYNCFLNVVLQSLWSLRSLRDALLRLPVSGDATPAAGTSADLGVLAALCSTFRAMAKDPAAAAGGAPAAPVSLDAWAVSPSRLRAALSALSKSQASVSIEMSEMHDASEVLGVVLNCLHRAELSRLAGVDGVSQHDVQLPQRIKAGSAVAAGAKAAAAGSSDKASTVHRLFGLDMQEPADAATLSQDSDSSSPSGSGKGRKQSTLTPAPPSSQPCDVLQFTKFFHLVHAQKLRGAAASMGPGAFFEDALRNADDTTRDATLLRRPRVFSLSIVWESPQASADAIRGTLEALAPEIDLALVFRRLSGGSPASTARHQLRAVICYFGHHYQAFALSEELQLWLLFDDANITVVGHWLDVCRTMLAMRLQPAVLLYESSEH